MKYLLSLILLISVNVVADSIESYSLSDDLIINRSDSTILYRGDTYRIKSIWDNPDNDDATVCYITRLRHSIYQYQFCISRSDSEPDVYIISILRVIRNNVRENLVTTGKLINIK